MFWSGPVLPDDPGEVGVKFGSGAHVENYVPPIDGVASNGTQPKPSK